MYWPLPFFSQNGTFLLNPYVAICNRAASSSNLGDPSIWHVNLLNSPLGNYMHPIIDGVTTGSQYYWLFIVVPGFGNGANVTQYQVNNSDLVLGSPLQVRGFSVNGNAWSPNDVGCTWIEEGVRATSNCNRFVGNGVKAAIDYCTSDSAHRMYIPTLADTRGFYPNGVTCDLFITVWQYAGGDSVTTSRVEQSLPDPDKQIYAACVATDGHQGIFVTAYIITPNYVLIGYDQNGFPIYQITYNYNSAQPGVINIDRYTGAGRTRAYLAVPIPQSGPLFLGDYAYSGAGWAQPGSYVIMPTFTDWLDPCGRNILELVKSVWE
jgi:hypothetical protein